MEKSSNSSYSAQATHTSQLPLFDVSASVPGLGVSNPDVIIAAQGANPGDTVYTPIHSAFDPRVLQSAANTQRYSNIATRFDYLGLLREYIYRIIFSEFKYRTEPPANVIDDIIDNVADIGRMLGILLTTYSLMQSRDPEMFRRARNLDLSDSIPEMTAMLSQLPLPRGVAHLNSKYIGLGDVSGNPMQFQNAGFLVTGDFEAFRALYSAVLSRPLALNFMRRLYPVLGLVGDPGPRNDSDVLEMWINAYIKTGDGTFCNWVGLPGSTGEAQRLASAGLLHSVLDIDTTARGITMTGWAVPGSGIGNDSQRYWLPYISRWKTTTNRDAAITRTLDQTYNVATGKVETVQDLNLCANIAHEYQMMRAGGTPPAAAGNSVDYKFNSGDIGIFQAFTATNEDTRYRVSGGQQLASLSYRLDANVMSGLYAMVAT